MYKNLIIVFLVLIIFMVSKGLYIPNTKPIEIVKIDTIEFFNELGRANELLWNEVLT
jgi:hypothetical protein